MVTPVQVPGNLCSEVSGITEVQPFSLREHCQTNCKLNNSTASDLALTKPPMIRGRETTSRESEQDNTAAADDDDGDYVALFLCIQV